MKKNNLVLLFLFSFSFYSTLIIAQEEQNRIKYAPDITATTPQVASMSKVGDIPIDISTGRINYTIPISEIKEGDFTMPINLSYNYSGLLLDDTPGHAGVGWTLNIGGSILHTINGLDDYHNENSKEYIDAYFYSRPPFNIDSPNLDSKISELLMRLSTKSIDGEPDKYTINVGNINSVFYIDKDGNPVFIKNENYKVIRLPNDGFKVIDDRGISYTFDLAVRAYKTQGDNSFFYTSAYLLTEINFANTNNKIQFQYDNPISHSERYLNETLTTTSDRFSNISSSASLEISETNVSIDVLNLKKIISNKYIIELSYDYNPGEHGIALIKNIIIKNNISNEIKNYGFLYSQWYGRRANLLNVSYNNVVINQMEYDMTTDYPLTSDLENTYFKRDLWGYYNSKALKPTNLTNPLFNPSIRPDFESTKIGALKKITYQTKGYSLIEYEPNEVLFDEGKINYYLPYDPSTVTYRNFSTITDQKIGGIVERTFEITRVPAYIDIDHYNLSNSIANKDVYEKDASVSLFLEGNESTPIFKDNQSWYWEMQWFPANRSKSGSRARIKIDQIGVYHIKSESTIGAIASIGVKIAEYPSVFNEPVGGIRVNKIKDCDFDGQCITTTYSFAQNGKSSGLMIQRPNFHSGFFVADDSSCPGGTYNKYDYYSFNSVYPLSEYRGSAVLYKIVEKSNIFNNTSNGKTIFTYLGGNSIFPNEDKLFKVGLLESEIINDQLNNPIKKNKNFYITERSPNESKYVASVEVKHVLERRYQNGLSSSCVVSIPRPSSNFKEKGMVHRAINYIVEKQETTSYYGGKEVVQNTISKYNFDTGNLKNQTVTNSKGETLDTQYFYAQDSEIANQPFVNDLKDKNIVGVPLNTLSYNGSTKLSEQKTEYANDLSTSNLLVPKYVYLKKGSGNIDASADKKITYNQYDSNGNILQYTLENDFPVSIIWGYNKTQPIAKIDNITYDQIASYVSNLQSLSDVDDDNCLSGNCKEQILRNALNSFRNSFPQNMVSTYTYNPLVGVTSITDAKGTPSYYDYDTFGRLKFVKDKDLNVLQKYCYNYKGQLTDCGDNSSTSIISYRSAARTGSFTKNNCAIGGVGSKVDYTLPEGAVISTTSQADADSQALLKLNDEGQTYANTDPSVKCTFKNNVQNRLITRNNCAAGGSPASVWYTVAAGIYSSNVSQAAADAQAQSEIDNNGQAFANNDANAKCTFKNTAQSRLIARNNCDAGGSPDSVWYTVAAGIYNSNVSQAAADAQAQTEIDNNGQAYANANGKCTFWSNVKRVSFTRDNCASGGIPETIKYTVVAGQYISTVSQLDADSQAQSDIDNKGQAYANMNGKCTFYSIAINGSFTKNDCTSGTTGSNVSYSQVAGAVTSTISQADANVNGSTKFYTDGQAYANANGICNSLVITNSCTLNFNRVSGSYSMYKNGSKYLTASTSGISSGTLTTGDTFYVVLTASATYYKTITITSSVRGILYDYGPSKGNGAVTSLTFTKVGSEVIAINCTTSDML